MCLLFLSVFRLKLLRNQLMKMKSLRQRKKKEQMMMKQQLKKKEINQKLRR